MKQRAINTKTDTARAAEMVAGSEKLKKAADALAKHFRDPENVAEPRLSHLGLFTEEQVLAINIVARKQAKHAFGEKEFVKAMAETTPVLARPRITEAALDMWRILAQPEILEKLWAEWICRSGKRGSNPGVFAKAIIVLIAIAGFSAHFNDNHRLLCRDPAWRALFEWLEQTSAAATGRKAAAFGSKQYSPACRQIHKMCDLSLNDGALTSERCVEINRHFCNWLRARFPEFGRRLGIDAMLVKAWVAQVGKRPKEREDVIRKHAPKASPRMIDGKDGKPSRFARGYYLVVLSDLATGVPVVWGILPAGDDYDDRLALLSLLGDLFAWDEDFPVEEIVADKAWNSAACVEDCAVRFGIHLISGLDSSTENRKVRDVDAFDRENIGGYDGCGNVYCREHGVVMQRDGSDFLGRKGRKALGLKPGEEAPHIGSKFRLRFKCPIGGGLCDKRASLPMSLDWNGFSYFPHTIDAGWADRQAHRLAMYARRNTCEGIFGALKLGHKLGLESADRTRTPKEPTVEAMLGLALLSRTAVITANERIECGLLPADPPPDLYEKLA